MVKQNFQKTDNPVQTFFKTPIFRSWGPILVAALLWFLMFSIWTKHLFNFWIGIAISASVLMVVAIILRKEILKQFDSIEQQTNIKAWANQSINNLKNALCANIV